MKLLEVFDEFENVKPNSAAAKFKYAERKAGALEHQVNILDQFIDQFDAQFVRRQYQDDPSKQLAPGEVSFEGRNDQSWKVWMVYHSLTPHQIAMLAAAYKKYCFASDTYQKLKKNLTTLKRNVAKESGTYVSRELLEKLEKIMLDDLTEVFSSVASDLQVTRREVRTRTGRGDTYFSLTIKDAKHPGPLVKAAEKDWKATINKHKDALNKWLQANGLDKNSRISFGYDYEYDPAGKASKKRRGTLEIRLITKSVTDRLKKLGKW